MIKFFINNTKQDILLAPTMTTTQDETLDSATIVLKANTIATPYAPMQACRIEVGTDKFYFYIATDEVSIFSLEQGLYQHKLTLTQNIRKLSKHMMRNTVFSQPSNKERKGYYSAAYYLDNRKGNQKVTPYYFINEKDNQPRVWTESLVIATNENVLRSYFKVKSIAFSRHGAGQNQYFCDGEKKPFDFLRDATNNNKLRFFVSKEDTSLSVAIDINENTEINTKYYDRFLDNFIKSNGKGKYQISTSVDLGSAVTLDPNTKEDDLRENTPLTVCLDIEIGCEVYSYTAYDVLDIINKQYLKSTIMGNKYPPLYEMPEPNTPTYQVLKSKIVPDMTFTQCTYFEAVSQVFKLFDAIFTLVPSSTNNQPKTLGIEFLNSKNDLIKNKQYVGRTIAIGEDKYNNGLVSYFQNALLEDKFPSYDGTAPARSMVLGVPEKENSWAFITPHPIEMVEEVKVSVAASIELNIYYDTSIIDKWTFKNFFYDVDITPFVFESSVWSLLNSTDQFPLNGNFQNITQNGTLTYTKGTNRINLSYFYVDFMSKQAASFWNVITNGLKRLLGNATAGHILTFPLTNSWDQIRMSCKYLASIDGRVKVESISDKYNGEMLSNQSSGAVDLSKLGLNMMGLISKLGEPTLSLNQERVTWDNAIKKGQYFLDEFNNEWVANVCNYIFYNDFVSTNIQFVKNFNGLAQYVKVDREKRLTNISSKLTMKCEDDFCEHVYLSSKEQHEGTQQLAIINVVPQNNFLNVMASTFGYGVTDYEIKYTELVSKINGEDIARVYLPLIKYGSGNALCFEMTMDDPYSAGNQTKVVSQGWFGEKNYFTKVVPYTNENGYFDTCDILFQLNDQPNFGTNFPDLTGGDNFKLLGKLENFAYYKKPNEIFSLNYELICLPHPLRINKDFVGKEFIQNNGLLHGVNRKKLYLYYTTTSDLKYSVSTQLGLYDTDIPIEIESVELDYLHNGVKFLHQTINAEYKTWAICDKEGNIYFASNEPQASTTENVLYFNTRFNRL